jgi:ORF6N domain
MRRDLPRPIEHHIYVIRGQKVMLDADLAALYEVETKMLNRAVRRNPERFPEHFMFQLTAQEADSLRYQIGTSKTGRGGRRYLPYVFTEHGVVMLSAVLNSARAVQMSIMVVQSFVRLREMIAANKDLAARVEKLEHGQRQTVSIFEVLVDEIEQMKALPPVTKRRIGFRLGDDD